MAMIELVDFNELYNGGKKEEKKGRSRRGGKGKGTVAATDADSNAAIQNKKTPVAPVEATEAQAEEVAPEVVAEEPIVDAAAETPEAEAATETPEAETASEATEAPEADEASEEKKEE
jgi:large subunit ribosomal protein L17